MDTEQLNFGFIGDADYNKFWNDLAIKLEPITKGLSLQEWIEYLGSTLYAKSQQTLQCVNLERYFRLTKIGKCVYNPELLLNARLISNSRDFTIELKDYGESNDTRLQRYFIAHEIAHTFFYNTHSNPIRDYKFFTYGSKEIEFLCNRIARSILIPNTVLLNKRYKLPAINDKDFSLEFVSKLCNAFRVPHHVLLNRLIFDTGLWDCLFLRFRYYENEVNKWKLRERYLPSKYWQNNKAYIPPEDLNKKKDNPRRFPSAKGKLAKIFDQIYFELKECRRASKHYKARDLVDSPLKSFLSFYFTESDIIKVHFSLGKDKYSKADYLSVCIPLPKVN